MIQRTRKTAGGSLSATGVILGIVAGLVGLVVNLSVVMEATGWGFWGGVVAEYSFQ
jgi:hypothetical protein